MTNGTAVEQASGLEAYTRLAESDSLRLRPGEAAVALGNLARDLQRVSAPAATERLKVVGRKLATPEVVETLLEAAAQPWSDPAVVAGALRLRGPSAVGAVLGRLYEAQSRDTRRQFFELARRLATFPELRDSLVGSLEAGLGDRRAEVVRNAIALLTAIGAPLPPESHGDLARSPHVQVRLALTQVVGRWKPSPEGLELLCGLIRDEHPGVRLAAALGLRNHADPRARQALEQCAATERDAETKAVCEGALGPRGTARGGHEAQAAPGTRA